MSKNSNQKMAATNDPNFSSKGIAKGAKIELKISPQVDNGTLVVWPPSSDDVFVVRNFMGTMCAGINVHGKFDGGHGIGRNSFFCEFLGRLHDLKDSDDGEIVKINLSMYGDMKIKKSEITEGLINWNVRVSRPRMEATQ